MVRKYSVGGDDVSQVSGSINSLLDLGNTAAPRGVPDEEGERKEGNKIKGWKCQSTVALLGFFGITVGYLVRVGLSIAIVAMVGRNTTNFHSSANQTNDVCPVPSDKGDVPESEVGDFNWDKNTQGMILASFFYGYLSTSLLGGRAAELYGGRIIFGLGIVLTSVLAIASPLCAYISKEALIVNRILQGMAQGVIFPAINTLMATWTTPKERSKTVTHIYIGIQAGTITGMSLGGWLCNLKSFGGWSLVFYVFGGTGILWGIAWFLLIHDRPETHPRISPEELRHLQQCKSSVKSAEVVAIPWKALMKSKAFLAIVLMYFSNGYGFYTLLTGLPTYFSDVQHFDLNQSGWTSAIPYLAMWAVSEFWAQVMNWLTVNDKISITQVRVLSNTVGSYGPALCLVAMCFVGCNSTVAMVIICLAVGLNGTCYAGYCSSTQDIAPNLAGTLLGLGNTLGGLSGSVAPMIMGAITNSNQTVGAWRIVFIIPICLWVAASTFYFIFITAEVQSWNEPTKKKKVKEENGPDQEYDGAQENATDELMNEIKNCSNNV
ncbi:putative inorganic phosphate cotransporter [Macrobrachium rosenbergii]|uniref:putative inorganic phosphate cotransporter n=1 Tax=Macrobrachium rosenbergii TaxID=79674 RepID=UPI0034D748CB